MLDGGELTPLRAFLETDTTTGGGSSAFLFLEVETVGESRVLLFPNFPFVDVRVGGDLAEVADEDPKKFRAFTWTASGSFAPIVKPNSNFCRGEEAEPI